MPYAPQGVKGLDDDEYKIPDIESISHITCHFSLTVFNVHCKCSGQPCTQVTTQSILNMVM